MALPIGVIRLPLLADHVNYYLQKVFETGVDEMSWDDMDDMQDEDYMWPSVAEAQDFRLKVSQCRFHLVFSMPQCLGVGWEAGEGACDQAH